MEILMEELFDEQVVTEQYEEQAASPWPLQNPSTIEETERQIRLRTRVAEYLEAQRRLEIEIARKAEEERIREEQKRLEEERKKLEAEVAEEEKSGFTFDPVLISLVRRAMPNLIAYDLCGVQPMTGPTGLIFAMRSKYEKEGNHEPKAKEPLFGDGDGEWCQTPNLMKRGTYEENHPWDRPGTVNSATRKKQAEEAAIRREEMRKKYSTGININIIESKEKRLIKDELSALDEPRNREIISERLREKWSKIINGTENW